MLWLALVAVAVLAIGLARARRSTRGLAARLTDASTALETLQQAFSRFVPAEVVEDIIARGISTRSEKKEITVLFADLQSFTPLAERLDPDVLVRVLNGWFERMGRAITAHGGHVAKFIGDGLLAHFGALTPNPWQTHDAVQAALAMRAALADYNTALVGDGLPALAMGVGIHRGTVVAGVIGGAELVEYGVIGSTVNLASRVEELTRVHGVDILVTEAVRAAVVGKVRVRAMPAVEVKGVAGALTTFAVEGVDGGGP